MAQFLDKVIKTLRHHLRSTLIGLRGIWWEISRSRPDRPIFVLGCSRAGTTLVYKTLSESPELGTLQRETHDFWVDLHPLEEKGWDTHALDASDASDRDRNVVSRYFYSWTGKSRFVDKNNQNGLCAQYLHELFPGAHFVYVKRHPGDNLNSLIEGWGKPGEFATWSDTLPAKVEIDNGKYTRWCFFLAEGWRNYLKRPIEEVCAFQYRAINEAILKAKVGIPPNQWHEVRYEDIVRDPANSFRSLFEACELSFTPALEEHCKQVLNRPYNAFSEIRLDKWKEGRNRERVERVIDQLDDLVGEMGYQVKS